MCMFQKEVQSCNTIAEMEAGLHPGRHCPSLNIKSDFPEPLMRSPLAVRTELGRCPGVDGLGLPMALRFQRPL